MKQKILWLFQLAIRDSRGSRVRLLLFSSATLLGIASLSAINSFRESVSISINRQAKSVLGADLVISSTKKPSAETQSLLDSIGKEKSQECSFASMIYFVKNGDSRLVQVRALEGGFPYYGALETEPTSASLSFRNKKEALVDATVMLQFEMQIGDTIKIGKEFFTIAGRLKKTPGQTGITASVSHVVYIPYSYLETTGLVIRGSRVNYFTYYQFVDGDASLSIKKKWKQRFSQLDLRATTWADSQQDSNESLKELSKFLNMIAFIALLLGCLGVGNSVYVYMKEKINTLSILRCIGASSTDIMWVFLLQIVRNRTNKLFLRCITRYLFTNVNSPFNLQLSTHRCSFLFFSKSIFSIPFTRSSHLYSFLNPSHSKSKKYLPHRIFKVRRI